MAAENTIERIPRFLRNIGGQTDVYLAVAVI
jgi:hypothetical protein